MNRPKLKVIPLGGLGEIGKNMMALEWDRDIIVIDAGLMFPEEEMLGIDLVIPDMSYLVENKDRVRGIFITHGHEDHTGSLPYLLQQINAPVYSTRLTEGLIRVKLKENRILNAKLNIIPQGGDVTVGRFRVEFFGVCHSIPDAVGMIITCPSGVIVHTGDFKLDYTPVCDKPTDLSRLAQVGSKGVLLLMSDSTYAELPGYTPSEQVVSENIDRIVGNAKGRVIVTTFASLISRIQQVFDAAANHNRRVFVVGRSMTDNVKMALELGYLRAPNNLIGRIEDIRLTPPDKVVLVTTGSQGEPTSALVRMANKDHKQVHIQKGDTIVLSATPIPGNEGLVNKTVDNLFKQGATVFYDKLAKVHVHGHGSQEELKLIINLVKPKYFMPIHGEYRHLSLHGKLAESLGMAKDHIFVMEDGDVLEVGPNTARISGKVNAGPVYVDGLSSDVGGVVLRNRRMLSQDGMVVVIVTVNGQTDKLVGRPDIITRGFVDTRDFHDMLESSRDILLETLDQGHPSDVAFVNQKVKDVLERYYYDQTKRHPMILPFVVNV